MTIFEARTNSVGGENQQVRHTIPTDELTLSPEEKILQLEATLEVTQTALQKAEQDRGTLAQAIKHAAHKVNNGVSIPLGLFEIAENDPTIFQKLPELVSDSWIGLNAIVDAMRSLEEALQRQTRPESSTPSHTSHPSSSPAS